MSSKEYVAWREVQPFRLFELLHRTAYRLHAPPQLLAEGGIPEPKCPLVSFLRTFPNLRPHRHLKLHLNLQLKLCLELHAREPSRSA